TSGDYWGGDGSSKYEEEDGWGDTDAATVSMTVSEVNDAPVAVNDSATTNEDTSVSGNVLTNDTDPDNTDGIPGNEDTLQAVLVSGPSHGTLTLDAQSGAITYTPSANFQGSDSFTYKTLDSRGAESNVATVTITVNEVNDAPVAADDSTTTTYTTLFRSNVLTNDTDPDNTDGIPGNEDTLQAVLVSGPSHGTLTLDAQSGAITYTPSANFQGSDSFTYKTLDSRGAESNVATVTITVNEVNDAPVAADDSTTTTYTTLFRSNVLTNDTDRDNTDGIPGNEDTIQAALVSGPSHGTLTLDAQSGAFTYTPSTNFWGSDSFTHKKRDNRGAESAVATVSLTVTEVNDAPVAADDTATTNDATALHGALPIYDTDRDNTDGIPGNEDTIQAALVSGPAHGTLTLDAQSGAFTYTPSTNFW